MVSEKLATDVYAFYAKDAAQLNCHGGAAATSGGIIVGKNGVLLIETLLNQRLNHQVQELTKKLSNNKPILFAVNTSSHGDHWYGNMYLPQTTMIIQHQNAKQYIDHHLDEDKAFMIQNFGKGRGIEEIKARTGDILVGSDSRIQIDLGGKLVDIIDFGFGQTGGDLFIWEPQSKVLWAGNPIIASKPTLPWLLDGHVIQVLETFKKVYNFLPSDATIVPGHGVAIKRDDIKWHIDYLTALQQNVQCAIDQGLTLEQTVKKATDEMSQFGGYVLFGWIHSGLNISKAYEELKKAK
jgi:glyoxylase-like metal-dependent hydrolase (beta-lactamase superfamily II)